MGPTTFIIICLSASLSFETVSAEDELCSYWEGSFYSHGYCFNVINEKLTWNQAKEECTASYPGRRQLAELKSLNILDDVISKLILHEDGVFNSHRNMWIGGRHDSDQNTTKWVESDSEVSVPKHLWSEGVNEKTRATASGESECLGLSGGQRLLTLQPCNSESIYICQEYIGSPCPLVEYGARYIDGKCFLLSSQKKNGPEAERHCEKYQGKLAEPTTPELLDFLINLIFGAVQKKFTVHQRGSIQIGQELVSSDFTFLLRTCGAAKAQLFDFETSKRDYRGVLQISFDEDMAVTPSLCKKHVFYNRLVECEKMKGIPREEEPPDQETREKRNSCWARRKVDVSCDTDTTQCYVTIDDGKEKFSASFSGWNVDSSTFTKASFEMVASPGELYFPTSISTVILGATNSKEQSQQFVWKSTDMPVQMPRQYWHTSEPNDRMSEPNGIMSETEYLALSGKSFQLSDENSGEIANFVCQWDLQLLTHVVMESADRSTRELHVTSSSSHIVPIHVMVMRNSTTNVTVGVSASHPFTRLLHELLPDIKNATIVTAMELRSTNPVTVILYTRTADDGYVFSALVYPSSVWSYEYFMYPLGPRNMRSFKMLFVALEPGKTRVKTTRLTGDLEEEELVLYMHKPSYLQWEDSVIHVQADKKIAVIGRPRFSGRNGFYFYRYLPVQTLSTSYLSLPIVPLYRDSQASFVYVVVSVQPESAITITESDDRVQVVTLMNAGDVTTMNLASTGSSIDGMKPVYLAKTENHSWSEPGSCPMAILPETIWATSYHFTASMGLAESFQVYVVVVYSSGIKDVSVLLDDKPVTDIECPNSATNNNFKSCYFGLETGSHSLRLKSDDPFMAYMFGKLGKKSFCHPLGMNQTEPLKIIIPTTTSVPETTSKIATEVTTLKPTTTETENTSSVSADPRRCQTIVLDGKNRNDTKTQEEVKKLKVNATRTSSYKRRKISASDSRPSSHAIFICSAVLVAPLVLLIVVPDVCSLLKHLYNLF